MVLREDGREECWEEVGLGGGCRVGPSDVTKFTDMAMDLGFGRVSMSKLSGQPVAAINAQSRSP